uniref:Uncharacterized protein n=1 Tax=Flavobacterium columnare TaxID=996 RepID=A0AA94F5C0_9FLAO
MPSEFPEVWLDQVIEDLNNTDQAPFFDGIPELDADVSEFGAGTATESNKIHVSTTDFDVDILINNNTYPIPVQVYDDGTLDFKLDKYQTKVITLSDDQTMGAAYDKIQVVTGKGVKKSTPQSSLKEFIPSHHIAYDKHTSVSGYRRT